MMVAKVDFILCMMLNNIYVLFLFYFIMLFNMYACTTDTINL